MRNKIMNRTKGKAYIDGSDYVGVIAWLGILVAMAVVVLAWGLW